MYQQYQIISCKYTILILFVNLTYSLFEMFMLIAMLKILLIVLLGKNFVSSIIH